MNQKTVVINNRVPKQPTDIYIGRPSLWGNPFMLGRDGNRGEKHLHWLYNSQDYRAEWQRNHIEELRGHRLQCYCAPLRCHGDNFVQYLGGEK
jgi:hypothetical protein